MGAHRERQRFFEALEVSRDLLILLRLHFSRFRFTGELFDLAGGQSVLHDAPCQADLLGRGFQRKERPCLTGCQFPFGKHIFHFVWKVHETQRIGYMRTALAHAFGELFLRQLVRFHDCLIGRGFFHRIQVLTLEVFDQCGFRHHLVVILRNDCRDDREPCHLCRAETSFAGDQLILEFAVRIFVADRDRLDQTLFLDGISKTLQSFIVEITARLPGIRMDFSKFEIDDLALLVQSFPQKRTQSTSQFLSLSHVLLPPGSVSYMPQPP